MQRLGHAGAAGFARAQGIDRSDGKGVEHVGMQTGQGEFPVLALFGEGELCGQVWVSLRLLCWRRGDFVVDATLGDRVFVIPGQGDRAGRVGGENGQVGCRSRCLDRAELGCLAGCGEGVGDSGRQVVKCRSTARGCSFGLAKFFRARNYFCFCWGGNGDAARAGLLGPDLIGLVLSDNFRCTSGL